MVCPDGLQRKCFPLLCLHVVDHKEALRATLTKKNYCSGCSAGEGQLHMPDCEFERKNAVKMKAKYETFKSGLLGDKDEVLEEKASEVWRVETQEMMGCRYAKHTIDMIYDMTYHMT